MKISVLNADTIRWPVQIPMPQDGGTVTRHKITIVYKVMSVDAVAERFKVDPNALAFDELQDDKTKQFLRDVIAGWAGVTEDDGRTEIEMTDELLENLLAWAGARIALTNAYFEMVRGAKAKN